MCRSPCMDFLPPLGGVFRLSLTGSSPGIPCRRLCGFQGAVLNLAIKKSPHNNLNLTIPSGMALVRVCYVAIRKLKTCSAPLRKRALLRTRHFRQCARKRNGNFGKKREPDGLVLLICFLPAAPDRVPAPHPPARRKCPPGCDTRHPERPDLPLPGTR